MPPSERKLHFVWFSEAGAHHLLRIRGAPIQAVHRSLTEDDSSGQCFIGLKRKYQKPGG
jgi:hypothetical protein